MDGQSEAHDHQGVRVAQFYVLIEQASLKFVFRGVVLILVGPCAFSEARTRAIFTIFFSAVRVVHLADRGFVVAFGRHALHSFTSEEDLLEIEVRHLLNRNGLGRSLDVHL